MGEQNLWQRGRLAPSRVHDTSISIGSLKCFVMLIDANSSTAANSIAQNAYAGTCKDQTDAAQTRHGALGPNAKMTREEGGVRRTTGTRHRASNRESLISRCN